MSVVCFASWLVNQKHFNIMELFKREITLQKIHYAQTEKVMKFCWSWSNFTPFKTKLHCLIISNRLLINSSLSQPNSVEIFLLNFNFHYALDKWCNSQISAEVTVSLGGWAKHAQGTLTAVTGFQKSSVHLELCGNCTLIYLYEVLCYPNGSCSCWTHLETDLLFCTWWELQLLPDSDPTTEEEIII